jgi:hypothetical protein
MSKDLMREQFEAEAKKHFVSMPGVRNWLSRMPNGEYQFERVHLAWLFWQSSREAVVVELPERAPNDDRYVGEPWDCGHNVALDECRAAIEAHGLKVAS